MNYFLLLSYADFCDNLTFWFVIGVDWMEGADSEACTLGPQNKKNKLE